MKELSIEENKESKDEKIKKHLITLFKDEYGENSNARFAGIKVKDIIAWLEKQRKNDMGISEATKQELKDNLNRALEKETPESLGEFLEKQGEHKPTIEMITLEESLGIDSETYNKIVDECIYGEQKHAEWRREDEQNLNACLGYIPDEYLRRWLTDIIHVKYDKHAELPKGEDYGIDGLYAAIDILQKTLGEVDGYQSDDGILTHKCAISAVKELSKQQKSFWSEGDEDILNTIINHFKIDIECTDEDDIVRWLKNLKERYIWKPSDEQMERLKGTINSLPHQEVLYSLYQDLKKLRGE